MSMETGSRERSLVYAVKGTKVPTIPEEIRGMVSINVIARPWLTDEECEFFQDFPIKAWECWDVIGAVVGFSNDGSLRLSCYKYDKCVTWVKNANKIYGVSDYGPVRGNYRLCRECGKIAGQRKAVNDSNNEDCSKHNRGSYFVSYRCPCGHVWCIEYSSGRSKGRSNAKKGFKPTYTNHNRKKCKKRTFYPQYA